MDWVAVCLTVLDVMTISAMVWAAGGCVEQSKLDSPGSGQGWLIGAVVGPLLGGFVVNLLVFTGVIGPGGLPLPTRVGFAVLLVSLVALGCGVLMWQIADDAGPAWLTGTACAVIAAVLIFWLVAWPALGRGEPSLSSLRVSAVLPAGTSPQVEGRGDGQGAGSSGGALLVWTALGAVGALLSGAASCALVLRRRDG